MHPDATEPTDTAARPPRHGLGERVLALPARRRLYDKILHTPGIHLRRLARELAMPMGTLEHHLRFLERFGLVLSYKDARRRAYAATEQVQAVDLPFLHALRHRASRALLHALLGAEATPKELAARLPMSEAMVAYHLRRLAKAGFLEGVTVGRDRVYRPREAERLARLLRTFASTYRGFAPASPDASPDEAFESLRARAEPLSKRPPLVVLRRVAP